MLKEKMKYRKFNFLSEDVDTSESEFNAYVDQEVSRSLEPIYFLKNHVKIVTLKDGIQPFDTFGYQENLIRLMDLEDRIIAMIPRQAGKTTVVAGYILHYILFNEQKTVGIVANKFSVAKEIIDRVKKMYDSVPDYLKPSKVEWNKESILLSNGSRVMAAATSSDAFTGFAINLLMIDEVAKIRKNLWDDFYASVYPTVSSAPNTKIVMISTPKGMNHFHQFWKEASSEMGEYFKVKKVKDIKKGKNGYFPFRAYWADKPGRDAEWAKRTINEIGEEKFMQEFECEFKGQTGALIPASVLAKIETKTPEFDQDFLKIYEQPIKDHRYVAMCDFANGDGGDYFITNIFDVTYIKQQQVKQVAIYRNNNLPSVLAHEKVNEIGLRYNSALVIGESNNLGKTVLDLLNLDTEYENIFLNPYTNKFGLNTNWSNKNEGASMLRHMMIHQTLEIVDKDTVDELSNFVKKGKGYEADKGLNDDICMTLVLLAYFMTQPKMTDNWLDFDDNRNLVKDKTEEKDFVAVAPVEDRFEKTGYGYSYNDNDDSDNGSYFGDLTDDDFSKLSSYDD